MENTWYFDIACVFKETPATNSKILVRSGTNTRDSSYINPLVLGVDLLVSIRHRWLKHSHEISHSNLQSVTKIVRLAPPPPLFDVGCKFVYSFLVLAAWHGFFRLGTTLSQGEGEILGNFNQA